MQVNCNVLALNACNAADNDLLAEQCTSVGGQLLNGLALVGCSLQLFQGGSVSSNSSLEHVLAESDEGVGLCHEVGLRVDLDHVANAVLNACSYQALSGCATLALGDALQTLNADDLSSLLLVAVSLVQSLLDVEHTCAGLLAQCLDVCCGVVRHCELLVLL